MCVFTIQKLSTQNYKNFALAHRSKRLFTQWDHKHYWKYIFFRIGAFPSQKKIILLLLAFALVIIHIYKCIVVVLFVGSLYIFSYIIFFYFLFCSNSISFSYISCSFSSCVDSSTQYSNNFYPRHWCCVWERFFVIFVYKKERQSKRDNMKGSKRFFSREKQPRAIYFYVMGVDGKLWKWGNNCEINVTIRINNWIKYYVYHFKLIAPRGPIFGYTSDT